MAEKSDMKERSDMKDKDILVETYSGDRWFTLNSIPMAIRRAPGSKKVACGEQ